jgi:hypothetical protein
MTASGAGCIVRGYSKSTNGSYEAHEKHLLADKKAHVLLLKYTSK